MSHAEVQRFANDLRSNESLQEEIGKNTTDSLAAVVGIAQHRGYDLTLDEAKDFIQAKARAAGKPLSDKRPRSCCGRWPRHAVQSDGQRR